MHGARADLLAGSCKQGRNSALQYTVEFRLLLTKAQTNGMLVPEDMQCMLFLGGLRSEIRRQAEHTPEGHNWKNLSALIRWVHSRESTAKASGSAGVGAAGTPRADSVAAFGRGRGRGRDNLRGGRGRGRSGRSQGRGDSRGGDYGRNDNRERSGDDRNVNGKRSGSAAADPRSQPCFKCGSYEHWAKDGKCPPGSGGGSGGGGAGGSSGKGGYGGGPGKKAHFAA